MTDPEAARLDIEIAAAQAQAECVIATTAAMCACLPGGDVVAVLRIALAGHHEASAIEGRRRQALLALGPPVPRGDGAGGVG